MRNTFFNLLSNKLATISNIAILLLLSFIFTVNDTHASLMPQVSAGGFHTVAMKSIGTVWAWGNNTYGQLGDGTNTESNTPVQVSDLTDVIAIACGYWHTAALKSDGTVWTWGNNTYGQLGDGTNADSNTPVQVSDLTDVIAIACGYWHTAAVKSDGTVWAWGNNTYGQLGDGTNTHSNTPVQVINLSDDITNYVAGVGDIVPIACGYWHTMVVDPEGTVWTWGNNAYGQLGDGTNNNSNEPVETSALGNVVALAGGYWHSIALKSDGTVWAWGNDYYGQLGDGSNIDSNIPVQVKLNPPTVQTNSASNITDSSATLNGTVNANGLSTSVWFEYGTGKGSYDSTTSTESISGREDTSIQIDISGLDELTTYYYRIVAENKGGISYGSEKNLTTSSSSSSAAMQKLLIPNNMTPSDADDTVRNILAIAGGGGHSICLKSDGSVLTFGSNYDGQLGDGTNDDSNAPILVSGLSDIITAIAGGLWHTVAVRSDGTVWTWGANYNGQLGDGSYAPSNTPVQVGDINLIEPTGNIYGYVTDGSGNYLESVSITLTGKYTSSTKTASSDENGYFEFEGLLADTYSIESEKDGYKKNETTVELEAGETKEIEIDMGQPLGSISGYLKNMVGTFLESVTITITGENTGTYETTSSNESGYFEFEDIEADTYTVVSKKKGYKKDVTTVELDAGEAEVIEIQLIKSRKKGKIKETK